MSDSDWDSYNDPTEKQGWPLWGKLFLGCGISFLVLLGSCVGFAYFGRDWIESKFSEKVDSALEKPWGRMFEVTEALQTDEGASKLYGDNPALASAYPDEGLFLKAVKTWRPKLADFPCAPPSYKELTKHGFNYSDTRSHATGDKNDRSVKMGYRLSDGTNVQMSWEGDSLVAIQVM